MSLFDKEEIEKNRAVIEKNMQEMAELCKPISDVFEEAKEIADDLIKNIDDYTLEEFLTLEIPPYLMPMLILQIIVSADDEAKEKAKEMISKINSKRRSAGGHKIHEKTDNVRDAIIEIYKKREWKTATQAAVELLDTAEDIAKKQDTSITYETLYRWILAYKKEQKKLASGG